MTVYKTILLTALLLVVSTLFSQETQGTWQTEIARQKFAEITRRETIGRYKGTITIAYGKDIHYDSAVIRLFDIPSEYRGIFDQGIFYPLLIAGDRTGSPSLEKPLRDSLAKTPPYVITQTNDLAISAFQEIKDDAVSSKIKRFSFYLWRRGVLNPSLYIFELRNKKARKKTSTPDFINGAIMTCFEHVSLLL